MAPPATNDHRERAPARPRRSPPPDHTIAEQSWKTPVPGTGPAAAGLRHRRIPARTIARCGRAGTLPEAWPAPDPGPASALHASAPVAAGSTAPWHSPDPLPGVSAETPAPWPEDCGHRTVAAPRERHNWPRPGRTGVLPPVWWPWTR